MEPSDTKKKIPFEKKPLPVQERLAMNAIQRWLDRLPTARSRLRVIDYVHGLREEAAARATVAQRAAEQDALNAAEAVQRQTSIPGAMA